MSRPSRGVGACTNCGELLAAATHFCPNCGKPIAAAESTASESLRTEAQEIVEAVRAGVVPRKRVGVYSVGRAKYQKALADDLAFVKDGGYKVRVLAGDWGYGKTHLLALFGEHALKEGFAVAHLELHAREAPLEKSELIVAGIIRNTIFPGGISLESYLRRWGETSELLDRQAIESWLQKTSPSLEFRAILRSVLASPASRDSGSDLTADAVRWLAGGSATAALAKTTGIRGAIGPAVASDLLTSYIRFICASGSKGLILMLDEAEAITSLTRAQKRDDANQTLKRLLDNVDERTHFEIIFATTNKFLEDRERGARSYPALWERLRAALAASIFNPRSTVLRLEPLSLPELFVLADTLQALHASAYRWSPSLTKQHFKSLAHAIYGREQNGPPRRFVRAIVTALDLLEADSNASIESVLKAAAAEETDE